MGSGKKERQAAAAARMQSEQQIKMAVEELEAVGVPTVEAQKIAISKHMPEVVGTEELRELAPSRMEDISVDPRLRESQMKALDELESRGESGFTTEEKAKFQSLRREMAGQEQARQASILQSLAQRGQLGSGAEIAARLSSSQASAEREAQAAQQMAAESAAARRQALAQAGQVAGQIRGQEFGEESQRAQAADIINRFNTQQQTDIARRNLERSQQAAEQREAIRRQEEQYNKGLIGQQYGQRMQKAQAIAQARTGASQMYGQQAAAHSAAAAQKKAATMGLIGAGIGAAATLGAGAMKDGGVKYADGGVEKDDFKMGYEEGGMQTEGRIVPGESYAGDRIDDKINSGEMVINVEQQQRLLDILRGDRPLSDLGEEEEIVEPTSEVLPEEGIDGIMVDDENVAFAGKLLDEKVTAEQQEAELKEALKATRKRMKSLSDLLEERKGQGKS